MKILKVAIIDNSKENTVFEVTYKNVFGKTTVRKAYRRGKHDLCYWLDNNNLISLKSDSLCTILDLGRKEFIV